MLCGVAYMLQPIVSIQCAAPNKYYTHTYIKQYILLGISQRNDSNQSSFQIPFWHPIGCVCVFLSHFCRCYCGHSPSFDPCFHLFFFVYRLLFETIVSSPAPLTHTVGQMAILTVVMAKTGKDISSLLLYIHFLFFGNNNKYIINYCGKSFTGLCFARPKSFRVLG